MLLVGVPCPADVAGRPESRLTGALEIGQLFLLEAEEYFRSRYAQDAGNRSCSMVLRTLPVQPRGTPTKIDTRTLPRPGTRRYPGRRAMALSS